MRSMRWLPFTRRISLAFAVGGCVLPGTRKTALSSSACVIRAAGCACENAAVENTARKSVDITTNFRLDSRLCVIEPFLWVGWKLEKLDLEQIRKRRTYRCRKQDISRQNTLMHCANYKLIVNFISGMYVENMRAISSSYNYSRPDS